MQWSNRLKGRLKRLTRRRQLDRDLDDELRFHLDMLARDNPDPRRRFGNLTSLQETCREMWMLGTPEVWWQDVRYAVRMLRRNPVLTTVAVVTLALAIGANTAIFSVMNGVMLRALPYPDSNRLAMLWSSIPKDHQEEGLTSVLNFADWKTQARSFESMAFYAADGATLIDPTGRLEPEAITYADVPSNFFGVLGVNPLLGRAFSDEDAAREEHVLVLSHELWLSRFAGSPKVLGEKLDLNGKEYQVIGVMPRDFRFPSTRHQLWAPAALSRWWPQHAAKRERGTVAVFGRLNPAYTIVQAQAEMSTIASRLEQHYPDSNHGHTARLVPLQAQVLGKTVPLMLLVLFGAVVFVLLIACTNVANLLLARGASREREFALRTALGAGRMRLVRQMLTESMVLALCGGSLGFALAAWGVRMLVVFGPRNIPRLDEVSIDFRVLTFTFAISVFGGVLFGMAPAWTTVTRAFLPVLALREHRQGHLSHVLVIAEFALAVVLLSGAGLLIRSFLAARAVDAGFQPQNVVTMSLNLHGTDEFYYQVLERLRRIPRVQSVGSINDIFFGRGEKSMGVGTLDEVEGRLPEPRDRWRPLVITPNSGDAFQALGMRLLKGRLFTEHDGEHDPLVVIVNEAMARRYWPGEDPIGKRFKGYPGNHKDWVTVVGLVKDLRNQGLEKEAVTQMFAAPRQFKPGAILVIRATEDPGRLIPAVRSAIREMDKQAVIGEISTLEQQLYAQTSQRRFQSYLLGLFSVIALALAAVGVYGLLHYSVAQRAHEIGIRMALGARPPDVVGMVVRKGLTLAIMGVAIGLAGALALTRSMASLLFGVTPSDPLTFLAVSTILIVVALIACYVPARRATRIDPIDALRCE